MRKECIRLLAVAGFATSLMMTSAIAQEAFSDWDADGNGSISMEEFETNFGGDTGVFYSWDTNDDNSIGPDELSAGLGDNATAFNERFGDDAFTEWDEDADGMLTETEFNEGVYAGYDADDSGVIEEPEYGDLGDDVGDEGFFDI
ncbi:hypothetical protein [Salinarimonas ramus]|uniref:EF-hand domain-containing protein n=1 Tax=Salinarimonas ramus TaxID=690164 RepID=A0A917QLD1_9HYPH|nr:hypothetical protein [Salinarimonas ramus]GGK54687.1 hypothetical protein GCM10011322_46840 [Salinarimonas ramus]